MNQVLELLAAGCALTLWAAVVALPLALVALVLDVALGRWMSARVRCVLWTLVAVRLLMPFAPGSSLSLQNVWRLVESPRTVSVERGGPEPAAPAQPYEGDITPREVIVGSLSAESAVIMRGSAAVDWEEVIAVAIIVTWSAGVVLVLTRASVASARFARRLRSLPGNDDPALLYLLESACNDLGVRRIPRVKYVAELPAPALFGVLRPTVCLPEESRGELSDAQLRMILLHEVMHMRRFDALQAWLLTVVRALHWFNPVAWLATGRVALYREEACDEAVRRFTQPNERSIYTDLLLRFAGDRSAGRVGFVGLCFARPVRHLTARIRAFGQDAAARRTLPRAAVVGVLALLVIAGLTDAATSQPEDAEPQTVAEWMAQPRDGRDGSDLEGAVRGWPSRQAIEKSARDAAIASPEEPLEERIHDLGPALAKLTETKPNVDHRRWLMSFASLPSLKPSLAKPIEGEPDKVSVVMTARQHESLASMLAAISRSGPWQVIVTMRVIGGLRPEMFGDIDWEDAVTFAPPEAHAEANWPEKLPGADGAPQKGMALSVESVSWDYSPFLAVALGKEKAAKVIERSQGDRRINLRQSPKVTVFSGQQASMRDETMNPFVVGVHYIKGDNATAAQPNIAVLTEGSRLDVEPVVIDAGTLDLKCRLTASAVSSVRTFTVPGAVPGKDVTVQNPRVMRHTISAHCRMAPGETLFIAPLPENSVSDKEGLLCFAVSAEWFPDTFGEEP
jgi:beta-lactamase regulating signal transducer with metallopeptidase domain